MAYEHVLKFNPLLADGFDYVLEDHKDEHDPEDGSDKLDTAGPSELASVQAQATGTSHSLARADHGHQIQHSITDNHLATIDGTTNQPVNTDYAKFTANGLEGREKSQILTDINVADGADVTADNAPQAHAASHQNIGGDEISVTGLSGLLADDQHVLDAEVVTAAKTVKLDDFTATDDNVNLDFSITAHGLCPKGTNVGDFLKDDGTWAAAGGGIDSGATVPATPSAYDLFVHTPTGRKVFMQYDGSNWVSIISLGTMTVYVDKTDGTDSIDKGGAVDAGAFATVQYAIDRVPPLFGGDVTININAETYSEDIVIRGKMPTNDYVLKLVGALTSIDNGTSSGDGVVGTAGTQGSVLDTGNMGAFDNLLIYLDADGDYRIVDSDTVNRATICGTFTSQPLINENWVVYDWGTEIDMIEVEAGQKAVELHFLKLLGTTVSGLIYCLQCWAFSSTTVYGCYLTDIVKNRGSLTTEYSYSYTTTQVANFLLQDVSVNRINRTKVRHNKTGQWGFRVQASYIVFTAGSIIDGTDDEGGEADIGMSITLNSTVVFYSTNENGLPRIRNCDIGVGATTGSQADSTAFVQYSGNTVPESADAASFGYID